MKFISTTAFLLVASTLGNNAVHAQYVPCLTAELKSGIELEECDPLSIIRELRGKFDALSPACQWNFNQELQLIAYVGGVGSADEVQTLVETLCEGAIKNALDNAPDSKWEDIHDDFTQDFMNDYADGGTYLNLRTGNFQNPDGSSGMPPGTDAESYDAGVAIDEFYSDGSTSTVLEGIDHLSNCQNQAIMCCFGRDRQFGDDNGACREGRCVDKPPGDNTNICFEPQTETPFPYDERVHCHGLLWGDDVENDPSNVLKFNNFFYVLMHDHMYSRGYVESVGDGIPMCECIEEMPVVLRADCSEVSLAPMIFTLKYDTSLVFHESMTITSSELEFTFNSCRGVFPNPDTNAENPWIGKSNDLASHAYGLWLLGKMDLATRNKIFSKLAGHAEFKRPEDKENEEVCHMAWDDATQGKEYYPE